MSNSANTAAWVAAIAGAIGSIVFLLKGLEWLITMNGKQNQFERDMKNLKSQVHSQSKSFQDRISSSETKTQRAIDRSAVTDEQIEKTIQDKTSSILDTISRLEVAVDRLWKADKMRSNDITKMSTKLEAIFEQLRDQLRDMEQVAEAGSGALLQITKLEERFRSLEETLLGLVKGRETDNQQFHELDKRVEAIDARQSQPHVKVPDGQ